MSEPNPSKRLRCPLCRAHLDLEALVMDEAQDALMQYVYRLTPAMRAALVPYLALFRAADRDMTPERALRLAREVAALDGDEAVLGAALSRVRESIVSKWSQSGRSPLKDHNYLRAVVVSVRADGVSHFPVCAAHPAPTQANERNSKTAQGVAALEQLKRER